MWTHRVWHLTPSCKPEPTTALCSFYAEEGGLMIGFEGGFNAENDNRKF